jgi:hypothetical protein
VVAAWAAVAVAAWAAVAASDGSLRPDIRGLG